MHEKPAGEKQDEMRRIGHDDPSLPAGDGEPRYMEIDISGKRRWMGLMAYMLFFLLVAGLLVLLFVKFTASMGMALLLVGFMVAYMGVMGYAASRNIERKE